MDNDRAVIDVNPIRPTGNASAGRVCPSARKPATVHAI
jgi:hypothetical protein